MVGFEITFFSLFPDFLSFSAFFLFSDSFSFLSATKQENQYVRQKVLSSLNHKILFQWFYPNFNCFLVFTVRDGLPPSTFGPLCKTIRRLNLVSMGLRFFGHCPIQSRMIQVGLASIRVIHPI